MSGWVDWWIGGLVDWISGQTLNTPDADAKESVAVRVLALLRGTSQEVRSAVGSKVVVVVSGE